MIIRHPAGFCSSLTSRSSYKSMDFPFRHFVEQPYLMERLVPFAAQIEAYAAQPPALVDQGILLWNILYSEVQKYQQQYPQWLYVRHEDLSAAPLETFRKVFEYTHLPFTDNLQAVVQTYTEGKKAGEKLSGRQENVIRDSRSQIFSWKKRLSDEEIRRIRSGTEAVASRFYTEHDW